MLAQGFYFSPSLSVVPIMQYIRGTESYIQSAVNHILLQREPAIKHKKSLGKAITENLETPSCAKDKETFLLRRSELGSFNISWALAPWNHGLINETSQARIPSK